MKELINFKDQNLNLDYLTLNIPNSVGRILEFAEIFFRYGFNSKVFYVATNESQIILEDKKLLHTLTFRLESDSWNKETLFILCFIILIVVEKLYTLNIFIHTKITIIKFIMYYNKILRIWVIDSLDYFLISAFIGSLIAPHLKKYLSEKAAMERLKTSIINKSTLISNSNTPARSSKIKKMLKISKVALSDIRGGTNLEEFAKFMTDGDYKRAEQIKMVVEQVASYLKKKELQGIAKILFKGGRLVLELILYKCNISITYGILGRGMNAQVIVFTVVAGGTAGFTLAWYTAGASFVISSALMSTFLLRSSAQQILNFYEYHRFKKRLKKLLKDENFKNKSQDILQVYFGEEEMTSRIEIRPQDIDIDVAMEPPIKHNFDINSDESLDQFIKNRMEKELGLVENPTKEQLQKIIERKPKIRPKAKTVHFRDLVEELSENTDYLLDLDVIDAEILDRSNRSIFDERIKIKLDNPE